MSHSGKFTKRSLAKLDYAIDWSLWLEVGETIASHTLTVEAGITKTSDSLVDGNKRVVMWLEGGTLYERYTIECVITTTNGRIDLRQIEIEIGPY